MGTDTNKIKIAIEDIVYLENKFEETHVKGMCFRLALEGKNYSEILKILSLKNKKKLK